MNDSVEDWERRQAEDRDLLTLAAKSAGLPLEWHDTFSADMRSRSLMPYLRETARGEWNKRLTDCTSWSPLTDDGDALRLAVKLKFSMRVRDDHVCVFGSSERVDEHPGKDPYAATRRAIVRAAASMTPNVGDQRRP